MSPAEVTIYGFFGEVVAQFVVLNLLLRLDKTRAFPEEISSIKEGTGYAISKVIEEIKCTVWIGHLDILVLLSRHFGTAQTLIDIERPNASGKLLATDDHPDEREKIYAVASQLDWFVKSGMRHCKTGHFVFRRSLTSLIPSFRA